MPIRTTPFIDNAYYHVFNRGVEKRIIYQDRQDYQVFLDILAYYLQPINNTPPRALSRTGPGHSGMFQHRITLAAYCLMPNHYHLLLKQADETAVSQCMHRLGTAYSMYFNQRHQRVGALFQSRFKAKHIDDDAYLLQTSKYIHRNPATTRPGLVGYPWSSYQRYLKPYHPKHTIDTLIRNDEIINHFSLNNPTLTYPAFVEETTFPDWFTNNLDWLPQ